LTTFIFEAVNFLILAGVLGWLLFNPVRRALADRRAAFEQNAKEAAKKLEEAERIRDEIGKKREQLDQELDRTREEIRAAAEQEAERIRSEARKAAEQEQEALKQKLATIEHAQMEAIANGIAATARQIVERFLDQLEGPDLELCLVRAACRELERMNGQDLGSVVVESTKPLEGSAKEMVDKALGNAAAQARFRVEPALGAGLRLTMDHGLIDASAAGLSAFAEQALKERFKAPEKDESGEDAND